MRDEGCLNRWGRRGHDAVSEGRRGRLQKADDMGGPFLPDEAGNGLQLFANIEELIGEGGNIRMHTPLTT